MVHIMATMWWPPTKNIEIAKKAVETAKKFPDDESLGTLLAQGYMGDKIGIKAITIWNVKEGKLIEALAWVGEILAFYAEVEGVTYKTDLMTTPEEAWDSVGMKPPE